jgi:ribosome-binding protein aMBF1 (putative translation factor)
MDATKGQSRRGSTNRRREIHARQVLELQDVLRLLRSETKRAGSQRRFATEAGVNVSVVSKTLRGQVLPSQKILRALNLRTVYLSE